MGFIEAVQSGFRNYVGFSGRACRSEFWFWVLFSFLLGIFANVVDATVLHQRAAGLIASLVTLLPGTAVTARRLHDVNKSGWWMLIALTIIGIIPLIYWYCQPGSAGENRFGPDPLPKAARQEQAF
jgi:uncharacterized membrane protein YhaH (DUF805 family)